MTITEIYRPLAEEAARTYVATFSDDDDVPTTVGIDDYRARVGAPAAQLLKFGWTVRHDARLDRFPSLEGQRAALEVAHDRQRAPRSEHELFGWLVEAITGDEFWAPSDLAELLRRRTEELAGEVEGRDRIDDGDLEVFRLSGEIVDVLRLMRRRLDRRALSDAGVAAMFISREMPNTSSRVLGDLVGSDPEYFDRLRADVNSDDLECPRDEARASLVAQIIYDLRNSASEEAIVHWFNEPREDLDECSPIAAIARFGVYTTNERLRVAARAGRGSVAA